MKYYDKQNNRLVFIGNEANESFWDDMWQKMISSVSYRVNPPKYNLFLSTTKKYLETGSTILEGGCGLAQNSSNFYLAGYRAIALDYTPKTIEFLQQKIPQVAPMLGDVRNLPFDDGSIDGYWSFGVIEHFYDGYDEIAKEASRVIRDGGYLFLTFPHMSKIRRWKANRGGYPVWSGDEKLKKDFYQFALDEFLVIDKFKEFGFEFVERKPFDGLGGWRREVRCCKRFFDYIYGSKSLPIRIISRVLDVLFAPFSSHSVLIVLRKKA